MLDLFPEGFVEERQSETVELAAYTDTEGAARLRDCFGGVRTEPVSPGWAAEWKRFHQPVEVGSLWIGPPWERPTPGLRRLVIDPGQAFGTGAHPTTQLCIEMLHVLEPGSVLDVGCGSGVLSIAAAALGVGPVIAIDSDESAVEATIRNAAANGVALEVRQADACTEELTEAEIVLANIDLPTLSALTLPTNCRQFVTSGYYEHDQPAVPGFDHLSRRARAQWAADLFMRE